MTSAVSSSRFILHLSLLGILTLVIMSGCRKKRPGNPRNDFTGVWHLTSTIERCYAVDTNQDGMYDTSSCTISAGSEYSITVTYKRKDELRFKYEDGKKVFFDVDEDGRFYEKS